MFRSSQARWLGSTVHTISVETAAVGMTFLTLASSQSLLPAPSNLEKPASEVRHPPAKYVSSVTRWGTPTVRVGQVKEWETYGREVGVWRDECDRVWKEWRKRMQDGWIGDKSVEREVESGVKTD
jgi:hypothetical protein